VVGGTVVHDDDLADQIARDLGDHVSNGRLFVQGRDDHGDPHL
jgi:hypothetical protein